MVSEFIPFRFVVNMLTPQNKLYCKGEFSEVSGLEMTMEPKVITEGGRNWGEIQRSGPTKFSPVILKRGVTELNHLWNWIDSTTRGANYGYRHNAEIIVYSAGGKTHPILKWTLTNVLPTRFKGPDLSSTANQVAIEELHLVHEGLTLEQPPAEGNSSTSSNPASSQS